MQVSAEGAHDLGELGRAEMLQVAHQKALDPVLRVAGRAVWHKPNTMPESVRDRLSCRHELIFLLVKQARYWFDLDAIREPLKRPDAAADPPPIGGRRGPAGCTGASARRRPGATVGDPFAGTATTGIAARQLHRSFWGIEISPSYARLAKDRLSPPEGGPR